MLRTATIGCLALSLGLATAEVEAQRGRGLTATRTAHARTNGRAYGRRGRVSAPNRALRSTRHGSARRFRGRPARRSMRSRTGLRVHQQRAERSRGPREVEMTDAAQAIGRRVFVATGSAAPTSLFRGMREFAAERGGVTDMFYMPTFASAVNFSEKVTPYFRPHLMFTSMSNRQAASQGRANMIRDDLHNLGRRVDRGEFRFDTVIVRVSPPDAHGYVSLGTTGDITISAVRDVLRNGGRVIAEVNPNVPRTRGGNRLRYRDLSHVYRSDEALSELGQMPPTAAENAIGRNIARLIPDGRESTLQVGIGGAINNLGPALRNKRLRIWSEMGSDWALELMQGERPAVREATFSFLHGTNNLYRFAHDNPNVRVEASTTVNDPANIRQQRRMFAINTALEVDLSGNTNAEQVGNRVISSPGGQPNFMEGAATSSDGRAIMALRSTAKTGSSTLVIRLNGPHVTTPGRHVDHVVTEWGATPFLRHATPARRAVAIIKVADPSHRPALAEAALEAPCDYGPTT